MYSAHFPTDLGSENVCQDTFPQATYVHFDLNVTALPVQIFMGICLPSRTCTQQDMTYVSDLFQTKINEVITWIDDNTP